MFVNLGDRYIGIHFIPLVYIFEIFYNFERKIKEGGKQKNWKQGYR